MARDRRRPARNRPTPPPAPGTSTQPSAPRPAAAPKPAWPETLDSFGGLSTILLLGGAVIAVLAMLVYTSQNSGAGSSAVSEEPLMGETITIGGAGNHVQNPAQLVVVAGQPPVGGPHFPTPQAPGAYDGPVPEGNTIHSLEHGIVWLSYNPSKVDEAGVKKLQDLQKKYSRDVILSPRPDNAMAVAAVSWERLMKQDGVDTKRLEQFIKTNRNRSPEPGVR